MWWRAQRSGRATTSDASSGPSAAWDDGASLNFVSARSCFRYSAVYTPLDTCVSTAGAAAPLAFRCLWPRDFLLFLTAKASPSSSMSNDSALAPEGFFLAFFTLSAVDIRAAVCRRASGAASWPEAKGRREENADCDTFVLFFLTEN